MMSRGKARLLLLAVFAARGTSFLFSKTLLQSMEPMSILAVRFLLAFLILGALLLYNSAGRAPVSVHSRS